MVLEIVARTLGALFLVVSHAASSHAIAARLFPAPAFVLRWAAMVTVGMALATLGFHVLAVWQVFHLPGALAASAALLAVVLGPRAARARWRRERARDAAALRRSLRALRRSPGFGLAVAFAVAAATVVLRPFVIPPLGYDSYVYHSTKAAMWVHEGGLRFLEGINTQQIFRNYPAGGEVFSAWGMLPFHDDFLAVAPEAIVWLALLLVAYALARELGLRGWLATAAAAMTVALPPVRALVGSGYVEPVIALVFCCALVFTVRFLRRGEPAALALACVGLGVAAGTKVTMLPLGLIVLAVLGVKALFGRRFRGVLPALLLFLVLAAPWYVYNTLDTGLPLSPFPFKIAGIPLGHPTWGFEAVTSTWVAAYDWHTEYTAFELLFLKDGTFHEALGPPAFIILGVFVLTLPLALWRRWRVVAPLALLVAANLFELYSPQLAQLRIRWPETAARFLVPAFLIAVPGSLLWCRRFPRLGRAWMALVTLFAFRDILRFVHIHVIPLDIHGMTLCAAGLLALGLLATAVRGRLRWPLVAAVGVGLVVWLHQWRVDNRYKFFAEGTIIGVTPRSWYPVARAVDDPPRRHRVAIAGAPFGKQAWYPFGLYGTRLQNDVIYVPPTRDGHVEESPKLVEMADRDVWVERLHRERIDHLACLSDATLECQWARELPKLFKEVYGEPNGRGVFRLKDPRPAAARRL